MRSNPTDASRVRSALRHVGYGPALVLMSAVVTLGALLVAAQRDGGAGERDAPTGPSQPAPDSVVGDELRELAADVAAYRMCEYLRGRFLALTSEGAVVQQAAAVVDGNLLVRECTAERVDGRGVRVRLAGVGWRWIARSRERIGATFEIDEYVQFDLALSTEGTLDFRYEGVHRVARVELVPTRPVQVDLSIRNDVEVKTESIWASIVGAGAAVIGMPAGRRVEQAIRRRGSHRLRAWLSRGPTLVVDLCTGQRYFSVGPSPPKLPPASGPAPPRPFLAHGSAVIHPRGILFAGPFETDEPVVAALAVTAGEAFRAAYVCEEQARRLADAYVREGDVPAIGRAVARQTVRADASVSLTVGADPGCRLVLVMRGPRRQRAPVSFTYTVMRHGARPRPWIDCEETARRDVR